MDCSNIAANVVSAVCGTIAKSGAVGQVVYLINYKDIDRTASVVTNNVITDLVLKTGKNAYSFTTYDKSLNDSGATFNLGTYRNTWTHNVQLNIFTKNEVNKDFVNDLSAGARLVVILENKEHGDSGDVKYEAYGYDNGLVLTESASTIAMEDGVVYPLNVSSEETAQEGSLPKSVFKTDELTTDAMIQALL